MSMKDDMEKSRDRSQDRDFAKQLMAEQHELNRDLLEEQHKLNKRLARTSGLFAVVASIVGVLVGVSISNIPSETPTITLQSPLLYSNVTTIYLHDHRKTMSEKKAQAGPALTKASSPNPTLNQTTNTPSGLNKVITNKLGN